MTKPLSDICNTCPGTQATPDQPADQQATGANPLAFASPGIPDSAFLRGDVPMTKEEIRWLILARLQLAPGQVTADIGCGSGSVTVEMARMTAPGQVYAMDVNPEAVDLTRQNLAQFHCANVTLHQGKGETLLPSLPPLDRFFIGGSGGGLPLLLEEGLAKLKPGGRMVLTAVTLETLATVTTWTKEQVAAGTLTHVATVQVGVTRHVERGKTTMMAAGNPVYLITLEKPAQQPAACNQNHNHTSTSTSTNAPSISPTRPTLTGIGVGPGDSDLLTAKGIKALQQAAVVFYPITREGEESAALNIVKPWLSPHTQCRPLLFAMHREDHQRQVQRQQRSEEIMAVLAAGHSAVMLTLGDALLYSTYSYVMQQVQEAGHPVSTIPGISAASAAAARLNQTLAEEDQPLTWIPGTAGREDMGPLLDQLPGNVVIYKLSACQEALAQWMEAQHPQPLLRVVSHLGEAREEIHEGPQCLREGKLPYLSLGILIRSPRS
ncbi:precorrin-2 C(20)-methyltransferase [Anoxynatronum sibiricum]|uniref:Precorrin-2 C(20)-methyltransferase n=1 Tax=Anoxynatronum sibiricum TaxID=210623 RepID=A0ABU9VST4_9CLOT